MRSVEYVTARLQATRQAQNNVVVQWLWPERTVEGWDHAIKQMAQVLSTRSSAQTALQAQTAQLNSDLASLTRMCRDVVRLGRTRFRSNPAKLKLFTGLRITAVSRNQARDEARKVREAWQTADAAWVPLPELTADRFNTALSSVENTLAAQAAAYASYREAAAQVMALARRLAEDCVAWYSDACVRFPAGTAEGAMIRAMVPTYSGAGRRTKAPNVTVIPSAKAA